MIQVHTYGNWRAYVIDGKPYPTRVAAKLLGLTHRALQKRMERGADISKPLKKHGGCWAMHGL